jgi:F0F1-type ATP synthase assembly protein I
MSQPDEKKADRQQLLSMTMAGLASQIGCLTVVIVLLALFGGLWLDRTFDTKPIFTILFVLVSAPLSLGMTFWFAMRAARRVNPPTGNSKPTLNEEEQSGE